MYREGILKKRTESLESSEIENLNLEVNFHGEYSEDDKDDFERAQREDFQRICEFLETEPRIVGQIKFEIFDTREGKQAADPNHSVSRASARFDEMAIYRYWVPTDDPHFPHETTHLVSHKWAEPYSYTTELDTADDGKIQKTLEMQSTSFMQEGLAIAVDDIVFGRQLLEEGELRDVDEWCRLQSDAISEIKLVDVINLDGFGAYENKIVMPFTASLSKYLLRKYGIKKYKEMYTQLRETCPPEENISVIENVYGLTEEQILDDWKQSIIGANH